MSADGLSDAAVVALCRTRLYRFSGDLDSYVFLEEIDERLAQGQSPSPTTLDALRAALEAWRSGLPMQLEAQALARAEGIDIHEGRTSRAVLSREEAPHRRPIVAVVIVGAPRSGTSHLLNLLAYQGGFAWWTSVSCWAWPTYHLSRTAKTLLGDLAPTVFAIDSKRLKLDPQIIVPTEAEDLMSRAIPSYRHLGRHEYDLRHAHIARPQLLADALARHAAHFVTNHVVLKSPFSTFRIPELQAVLGPDTRYVHIHRDGYAAAASIEENGFVYRFDGVSATATASWAAFVRAALEREHEVPMLRIAFEELTQDPEFQLRRLLSWLKIDAPLRLPVEKAADRPRVLPRADPLVEAVHHELGRTSRPIG